MECRRCQSLMVEHDFFDLEGTQGFMWMKGWRCMICGHAKDPVSEANQRLHEATEHLYRRVAAVRHGRTGRTKRGVCYNGDHSNHR